MVGIKRGYGAALAAMLGVAAFSPIARAQDTLSTQNATTLPDVTVTADRVEEPVNSTGSDVTVIPGSRIQQRGAQGITEVLREVVGVTVTQTAGPSSLTEVRLRGADSGQALVMIDGVPIGNVAGTDGSVDFGNLTALDIDRIEIVRGPQSSLYGSDAMSGVINIITKKGAKGKPVRTVNIEGGSYGTIQGRASISPQMATEDAPAEGPPAAGSAGVPAPPASAMVGYPAALAQAPLHPRWLRPAIASVVILAHAFAMIAFANVSQMSPPA
jgi:outer membrane cobalamin receptor